MSKSYQIVILKKGLAIIFIIVNLFGLWPFRFVHRNRQIKYSFIKAIYSILLVFFGIISYQVIGSIAFNSGNKAFLGSFTLRFVLMIYAQSVLISVMFAYIGVHWFAKEIEIFYIKWVDLVREIGDSFGNIDLSGYIFEISMRMIVIEIVQAVGSFTYMTNIESSTEIIRSRPYLVLLLQLTPYAARLYMNIFYGFVIAIEVVVKVMNARLVNILTRATETTRHRHIEMCNYCYCSDEVDRLSTLHSNLAEAIKSINSIFSINILLWTTTIILTLTVQFLNQAISIIELSLNNSRTALMFNAYGCISIIVASIDQLTLSNACQRLNDTARQTSSILHSGRIGRDVDARLRKSIDDLSMQILLNKLQIRAVVALDATSSTMVITTTVSYFVVLLQFELAERKLAINLKAT